MDLDMDHTARPSGQDGVARTGRPATAKTPAASSSYAGIWVALGMLGTAWGVIALLKLLLP